MGGGEGKAGRKNSGEGGNTPPPPFSSPESPLPFFATQHWPLFKFLIVRISLKIISIAKSEACAIWCTTVTIALLQCKNFSQANYNLGQRFSIESQLILCSDLSYNAGHDAARYYPS